MFGTSCPKKGGWRSFCRVEADCLGLVPSILECSSVVGISEWLAQVGGLAIGSAALAGVLASVMFVLFMVFFMGEMGISRNRAEIPSRASISVSEMAISVVSGLGLAMADRFASALVFVDERGVVALRPIVAVSTDTGVPVPSAMPLWA